MTAKKSPERPRRDITLLLSHSVRKVLRSGEAVRAVAWVRFDPGVVGEVSAKSELLEVANPLSWLGLTLTQGNR